jgi:hypothetical protein
MKLGIVGSRGFANYSMLKAFVNKFKENFVVDAIISGGAIGADQLGAKYAKDNDIQLIVYPADWNKYGKSAGYKRNKLIVEDSDVIIAFWDGISPGTEHTINLCKDMNTNIIIYNYRINKIDYTKNN